MPLIHGKWRAIDGLIGKEKPTENCDSRSAQDNQRFQGLLHTSPLLGLEVERKRKKTEFLSPNNNPYHMTNITTERSPRRAYWERRGLNTRLDDKQE